MITGRLGNEASAALHCGKLNISIISASTDINVIISKGIIQMSVRQYYIEYHRQLIFVGKAFLSSHTQTTFLSFPTNLVFTTILNLGANPPVLLMCPCFPRVQCGEVVGCVVICIVVALYLLLVATGLIVTAGTPGVMG